MKEGQEKGGREGLKRTEGSMEGSKGRKEGGREGRKERFEKRREGRGEKERKKRRFGGRDGGMKMPTRNL